MKLNNLKKFSALVLTLAVLMILTACRFYELILQIESIEVVTIENAKTTYIQGEELNLEEFEITVNFGDDRTSTFTAAEDGVSSVYLADPFVDMHFEAGQRIINQ